MTCCLRCGRPTADEDTAEYCPDCLALIDGDDDELDPLLISGVDLDEREDV